MPVLENWCGYAAVGAGARAGKHRLPLLVGPGGRPPPKDLVSRVKRAVSRFDVKTIAEAYPKRFEYAQLARHPALVLIPYQVSVMSLFEYYRMCLPLFVPSKELLWSWHKKFKLLKERTWFGVHGRARRRSPLDRHANATRSGVFAFDPNDDFSDDAALAWLELTPTDARGSSPSRLDAPPPAAALRRLPRPGPPGAVALGRGALRKAPRRLHARRQLRRPSRRLFRPPAPARRPSASQATGATASCDARRLRGGPGRRSPRLFRRRDRPSPAGPWPRSSPWRRTT